MDTPTAASESSGGRTGGGAWYLTLMASVVRRHRFIIPPLAYHIINPVNSFFFFIKGRILLDFTIKQCTIIVMKKLKSVLGLLFCILVVACSASPDKTSEAVIPGPFVDVTAVELAGNIRVGWNLGNTLDASDLTWLGNSPAVADMETAWGNPVTTKATIDAVKKAGFNAIRIPVSWGKCANKDYTIRADWMRRVQKIVDYAVSNDMYIILNTHHDEGIFKFLDKDMPESRKAFQRIWEQIAETFRDYNEKLIFEGLNEPRTKGSAAEWNGGTVEERNNLNLLHQLFVDTVRASGGNNVKRILMVSTYAASATVAAMNGLVIPADPLNESNRIIVSIHAYEPYNFALNENSNVTTWSKNNLSDTSPITGWVDRAYTLFVSRGFPVILGEFGSLNRNDEAVRAEWAEYYVSYAKSKGIKCFWWDDGGNISLLNRRTNTFYFPQIVAALMRGSE
jgi:endoglucanase